jgi:DNA invertase Pin-like site-specific DNA recombinase
MTKFDPDITSAHVRLMLTVCGGLAESERELIRAGTGEGRVRGKGRGMKMARPFEMTPHKITSKTRGSRRLGMHRCRGQRLLRLERYVAIGVGVASKLPTCRR